VPEEYLAAVVAGTLAELKDKRCQPEELWLRRQAAQKMNEKSMRRPHSKIGAVIE
jgi:hypothetical protein